MSLHLLAHGYRVVQLGKVFLEQNKMSLLYSNKHNSLVSLLSNKVLIQDIFFWDTGYLNKYSQPITR